MLAKDPGGSLPDADRFAQGHRGRPREASRSSAAAAPPATRGGRRSRRKISPPCSTIPRRARRWAASRPTPPSPTAIASRSRAAKPMRAAFFAPTTRSAKREVRLIVLHPEALGDSAALTALEREVEKLVPVQHPNLLGVFGFETVDRGSFLVLEWTEGFSVLDLLKARRELEADEALKLLAPGRRGRRPRAEPRPERSRIWPAPVAHPFSRSRSKRRSSCARRSALAGLCVEALSARRHPRHRRLADLGRRTNHGRRQRDKSAAARRGGARRNTSRRWRGRPTRSSAARSPRWPCAAPAARPPVTPRSPRFPRKATRCCVARSIRRVRFPRPGNSAPRSPDLDGLQVRHHEHRSPCLPCSRPIPPGLPPPPPRHLRHPSPRPYPLRSSAGLAAAFVAIIAGIGFYFLHPKPKPGDTTDASAHGTSGGDSTTTSTTDGTNPIADNIPAATPFRSHRVP